ncbi:MULTISPECIES: hypothetical protein [Xanthomonas]|nr:MULTISPECIES: hypothetical protein [Xanthomonas]CAD1791475.1 hypothetical protein XSP_001973 [Xanthomonas sp. CPBF 426]CAE1136706.1 hypothetical protein XTG_002379 [Xanthomonas euroxanthea]CAG2089562.1 hypothetical protein XCY_001936 [Xanthomonas euroxanthea]
MIIAVIIPLMRLNWARSAICDISEQSFRLFWSIFMFEHHQSGRRLRFRNMLAIVALSLVSIGSAQAQTIKDNFQQWLGHQQKAYYVNKSTNAIACPRGGGGACIQGQETSGTSQCVEQSFNIGASWEPPIPPVWGAFSLSGGGGKSWSACHERSESVTCQPDHGFEGRAANWVGERMGRIKMISAKTYRVAGQFAACPPHFTASDFSGKWGRFTLCTFNGAGQTVDGYLPEFERQICLYTPI